MWLGGTQPGAQGWQMTRDADRSLLAVPRKTDFIEWERMSPGGVKQANDMPAVGRAEWTQDTVVWGTEARGSDRHCPRGTGTTW